MANQSVLIMSLDVVELNTTKGDEMEEAVYVICVVALDRKVLPKRVYKNFYVGIQGEREQAVAMQDKIRCVGFKAEGERIFPDDIESINLKRKDDVDAEEETNT